MMGLDQVSAYLSGPALTCALVGLGLVVGVLTGLFGVGGAFLIVPLLNILLGIDYPIAVGSSLSYTVGTSATGVVRHMRLRNVELKTMLILAGGAVCGTVLGTMLHVHLDNTLSPDSPESFAMVMDGTFVLVLLAAAYLVFKDTATPVHGKALLQRVRLGPRVDLPHAGLEGVDLFGLCLVGLAVGVFKGMLGIGGGVLFMPVLLVVVGLRIHQAVGTSLGVVLFSSIAGTVKHGLAGNVNLYVAMTLLVGSVVGVQIGAHLTQKLHGAKLRRYFVLLVLAVAVALGWDFLRKLLG